jgi:hypothetical protein
MGRYGMESDNRDLSVFCWASPLSAFESPCAQGPAPDHSRLFDLRLPLSLGPMASTQSMRWLLPPGTHSLAVGTNLRGNMVGSSSPQRPEDDDGPQPLTEYISMRCTSYCTYPYHWGLFGEFLLTHSNSRPDNFKPPAVANARGVIQQAASSNEYQMQLTSEVRPSLCASAEGRLRDNFFGLCASRRVNSMHSLRQPRCPRRI